MLTASQLVLILGMAFVTYIPRALPIVFFANREVPSSVKKWLTYIPSAVFAALVFSDVFFWNDQVSFSFLTNKKLIPFLLVLIVSIKTKSLTLSILTGIGSLALLLYVF